MTLFLRCAAMFSASCLACFAQSQTPANHALIQSAIEHRWNGESRANEFTYVELWHTRNLDKLGHVTADESAKFESISFAGKPYLRMVEKNGKPLQGQDASSEEQSYDDSIANGRRRSMQERVAEIVSRNLDLGLNLDLLPMYFHTAVVGLTKVNDRDAFEFLCTPLADIKPKSKADRPGTEFNVRVWIDANDLEFLRVEAELLKDHENMLPGTTIAMNWAPVDGVWLPQQITIRGTTKDRGSVASFETEYQYSNYRRFHSNAHIVGAPVPVAQGTPSGGAAPSK